MSARNSSIARYLNEKEKANEERKKKIEQERQREKYGDPGRERRRERDDMNARERVEWVDGCERYHCACGWGALI